MVNWQYMAVTILGLKIIIHNANKLYTRDIGGYPDIEPIKVGFVI